MGEVVVRVARGGEEEAWRAVHVDAFETDAEARLVDLLRRSEAFVAGLSLVAEVDGRIFGHLLMTRAVVRGEGSTTDVLALAPMAVMAAYQRKGIGSMLVRAGLERARGMGERGVIVLGHAAYYPRFGFERASAYGVRAPFDVPDEALMIAWLSGDAHRLDGVIEYAPEFSAMM